MPQQDSLAILFADVSESTKLYAAQGDDAARRIIAQCVDLMVGATQEHGGTLIKVIGDEVMCTFGTADAAAAAAFDMQEAVSCASFEACGRLSIHVGFHAGPALLEDGDVFGDAVNLASRMVNQAKADQVLTTGATRDQLSERWQMATRQVYHTAVRGSWGTIDVFELVWHEANATRIIGEAWVARKSGPEERLVLTHGPHRIDVTETHPSVTIGRGEQNQLVIREDLVSRLHARVEYRNRRFALMDQSTNGTYVTDETGTERFVYRDTHVLAGSGTIALGRRPEPGAGHVVTFAVSVS